MGIPWPSMRPYGWTCEKCPHRGTRGAEDDWVRFQRRRGTLAGYDRSMNLAWPERCRSCDARYKVAKRAREAGLRLDIVRRSVASGQDKNRLRYLKFVTCTWKSVWCDEPEPDMKAFKSMWARTRPLIVDAIGAVGGTDVIEVVSKTNEAGQFKHHIHTHGLWCAPFVPLDELQAAFADAGVGRFEYTILKEEEWVDSRGEDRVKRAIHVAIDYLAKYLSKCEGVKRQVWGELRSWKDHLPQHACRACVKVASHAEKQDHCQCTPEFD